MLKTSHPQLPDQGPERGLSPGRDNKIPYAEVPSPLIRKGRPQFFLYHQPNSCERGTCIHCGGCVGAGGGRSSRALCGSVPGGRGTVGSELIVRGRDD